MRYMSVQKAGIVMWGINEDRYWDQYQVHHDPQWYDADEDVEDDFTECDQADMEVDEMLLNRG